MRACDAHWRNIEDNNGLSGFAQASQNIAMAVALLRGLVDLVTPEDRRAHHEIHTLLEHAVAQQAETSLSWRCELHAS
jgi:hypothetical protein